MCIRDSRKLEQYEDNSKFSTEDYDLILLLESEISHEKQLFSQRKYVYPFYFLYLFLLKDCSEDQVFYL